MAGIPAAPRNVPKIEVSFDIDVNGILMVRAKDNSTGAEQSITIEGSSKLSDSDIERMIADAEQFAAEDKKRREVTQVKNEADTLIYETLTRIEEVDEETKKDQSKLISNIESEIESLRELVKGEDVSLINKSTQKITELTSSLTAPTQNSEPSTPSVVDV